MHRIPLFLLAFTASMNSYSQTPKRVDSLVKWTDKFNGADIVFPDAKYPPSFPGGKTAWISFLKNNININLPLINGARSGTYYVFIRFSISREGVLRNVAAESNCGFGMEKEVMRCMALSPKWTPAMLDNKEIVSFVARQMVVFTIKGTAISVDIR